MKGPQQVVRALGFYFIQSAIFMACRHVCSACENPMYLLLLRWRISHTIYLQPTEFCCMQPAFCSACYSFCCLFQVALPLISPYLLSDK